ncbi:hypothetical protein ACI65C_012535 [Semiaphis heraclei]
MPRECAVGCGTHETSTIVDWPSPQRGQVSGYGDGGDAADPRASPGASDEPATTAAADAARVRAGSRARAPV